MTYMIMEVLLQNRNPLLHLQNAFIFQVKVLLFPVRITGILSQRRHIICQIIQTGIDFLNHFPY